MPNRLTTLAGFFCLLTACNGNKDTSARPSAHVRDSAGVQLVHNPDATVDTTSVQLVEVARLGVMDGDEKYQFDRVSGIARDDQGRLFIIDQGTRSVRVFDSRGQFVRRFGGPGEGPGEFTRISGLFRWRDTIHVSDVQRFQSVLFDTTGALLAVHKVLLPNGSRLSPVAGGPRGWYVSDDSLFSRTAREAVGVPVQYTWVTARLDPRVLSRAIVSREAADSLLTIVTLQPAQRIFGTLGSEDGRTTMVLGNPAFFEPQSSHGFDTLGHIYLAAGWPYRIDVHDANGRLIRRISRAHDSIPVTPELTAEVLRRAKAYYDTTAQRGGATMHTYRERAKLPAIGFVPVTGRMYVSPDGWIWVRRRDVDPDPATYEWTTGLPPRPTYWDVFDSAGTFQRMVRLPERFTPHVVLHDAVIGVLRDELDVQYVVRLEVRDVTTA